VSRAHRGSVTLAAVVAVASLALAGCGGGGTSPSQRAAIRSAAASFTRELTAAHVATACALLAASSQAALGAAAGEGCVEVLRRVEAVSTPVQLTAIGQRVADLSGARISVSDNRASWHDRLGALYARGHWRIVASPSGRRAIANAATLERWLSSSAQQFLYPSQSRF